MTSQLQHQVDVAMGRGHVIRRRDFLRNVSAGAAAAGAMSFTDVMSLHADELRRRGMACILLWMQGGPSQFETFSPLPNHDNGGETKAISTSVPGIHVAEHFPKVAGMMDELAIIRSMTSREGSHPRATFLLHTGYLPTASVQYPTLGSIVSHQVGDPTSDLPGFVRVGPMRNDTGGGLLGVEFDPFVMQAADRLPQNIAPATSNDRFRRRLELLGRIEADYASNEGKQSVADHSKLYDKASKMMLSSKLGAFDVQKEPDTIRDAYGRTPFGSGCLLARRLVEAGVTFVEVISNGWDTHFDNFTRSGQLAAQVDQPMAQLIADLKQRGMLDKTLVIWMGEFGRTPRINPRSGRDHYPRAFNVAVAGGRVRGGQVVGRVDKSGSSVADRPVTVPDLFRSFCELLEIDADHQNMSPIGRPIPIVEEGTAVSELFS